MTSAARREDLLRRSMRSTLVGVVVNLLLALGKSSAGILGNSYALIADGIESLTDVMSSVVVYLGLRYAARPADANHPYGHGKAEPMAAAVVAIALMLAAIVIAVESVREIVIPHHAPEPWTLIVLAIIVLIKEILFRYVFRVGEQVSSIAVKTDAWHHRSDAITSALAFVGISVALLGGPGWEPADDWAALGAAGIILFNAWNLLRPALSELGDESPAPEFASEIRRVAAATPGVLALEKCFVRKMGFDYYVDLHVLVDGDISVRQGHDIAHAVKEAIRSEYPQVVDVLVHVEPPEYHPELIRQ